jgi:hypothetical protein
VQKRLGTISLLANQKANGEFVKKVQEKGVECLLIGELDMAKICFESVLDYTSIYSTAGQPILSADPHLCVSIDMLIREQYCNSRFTPATCPDGHPLELSPRAHSFINVKDFFSEEMSRQRRTCNGFLESCDATKRASSNQISGPALRSDLLPGMPFYRCRRCNFHLCVKCYTLSLGLDSENKNLSRSLRADWKGTVLSIINRTPVDATSVESRTDAASTHVIRDEGVPPTAGVSAETKEDVEKAVSVFHLWYFKLISP